MIKATTADSLRNRRFCAAGCLNFGVPRLGFKPAFTGALAGARGNAVFGLNQSRRNHDFKPASGGPEIGLLGTLGLRFNEKHVAVHKFCGKKRAEALNRVSRQPALRQRKPQLHGRSDLVDILPARAAASHCAPCNGGFFDHKFF